MKSRMAVEDDCEALARMRWDFHSEDEPDVEQTWEEFQVRFGEFFKRALDGGRWFIWVAEAGGQIVSHIYVYAVPRVPRPDRSSASAWGYVTNVYTAPASRGQGIGGGLLAAVRAWASERDLELLLTWPDRRSVTFYERAGFQRSSEAMELTIHGA